jgi:hypothetical protein
VTEALEQLLSYLVWRDTKAALLLFIRQQNVTVAIGRATNAIQDHRCFKAMGTHHTEGRIDFVLHAIGDPNREIHLALLPLSFRPVRDVASRATSRIGSPGR